MGTFGTRSRVVAVPGETMCHPARRRRSAQRRHYQRGSPAAVSPVTQLRAFRADRGVIPVARVEPGVVGEVVENPGRHVLDQRVEVLRRPRLAHAAREQRVALTVKMRGCSSLFGLPTSACSGNRLRGPQESCATRVRGDETSPWTPIGTRIQQHACLWAGRAPARDRPTKSQGRRSPPARRVPRRGRRTSPQGRRPSRSFYAIPLFSAARCSKGMGKGTVRSPPTWERGAPRRSRRNRSCQRVGTPHSTGRPRDDPA